MRGEAIRPPARPTTVAAIAAAITGPTSSVCTKIDTPLPAAPPRNAAVSARLSA